MVVFQDAARTNKQTKVKKLNNLSQIDLPSGLCSYRDSYMCEGASLHRIQEDFDLASLLSRS